ncbi:hypothetical protein HZS61_013113 [Fusarium oxysporum f. sp. conglutinans]|uniref:Uncharacterized protein n=2 Tax=Fusarium oxysporum f. sp. conglutinans TaxID=100902 RepID=A0A8H6LLK5_FUSOX
MTTMPVRNFIAKGSERRAVDRHSLPSLVLPLVLLGLGTAWILFVNSDPSVSAVFTKCFPLDDGDGEGDGSDGETTTPFVATIPIVGPPVCCLVSFFRAALDSHRSAIIMGEILSYVGALLTVTTLESARACNQSSSLIRNPTPSWLLFNLAGGAVVWQLVIIPSFLSHERKRQRLPLERCNSVSVNSVTTAQQQSSEEQQALLGPQGQEQQQHEHMHRHLDPVEPPAISVGVVLGYFVPCMLFVLAPGTVSILAWLFFPAYSSIVRIAVRRLLRVANPPSAAAGSNLHPESSRAAVLWLYLVPILWSVVAHWLFLYNIAIVPDDRSHTTRAALGFIIADFTAIGLSVVYWMFVEAGWRLALLSLAAGAVLGPGAGLCLAWVLREGIMASTEGRLVHRDRLTHSHHLTDPPPSPQS